MKAKYKILITISCFVAFYFSLIPVNGLCAISENDCGMLHSLITVTHLTVPSVAVWDAGVIEVWSGTVQGVVENYSPSDIIEMNQSFILTVIAFPCGIIGVIVLWDKRK